MLTYEYKVDGTTRQYTAIDEAIRTVQFIRPVGVFLTKKYDVPYNYGWASNEAA